MKLTCPQLRLFQESDVDRRRAEREVQAHGDVSSAVRVLVNRIRSGEVDEDRQHRISAAASLGDPVAQAVGLPKFHEIKSDEHAVTMLRYLEPEEVMNFVADCVEKVGLSEVDEIEKIRRTRGGQFIDEYPLELRVPQNYKIVLNRLRSGTISQSDALDIVDNYSEIASNWEYNQDSVPVFEAIAYLASFIVSKFNYKALYHSIHFLRQAGLDVNWFKQKLIDALMNR